MRAILNQPHQQRRSQAPQPRPPRSRAWQHLRQPHRALMWTISITLPPPTRRFRAVTGKQAGSCSMFLCKPPACPAKWMCTPVPVSSGWTMPPSPPFCAGSFYRPGKVTIRLPPGCWFPSISACRGKSITTAPLYAPAPAPAPAP
jgi:hypothetical protein